jgi:hypothetical protein
MAGAAKQSGHPKRYRIRVNISSDCICLDRASKTYPIYTHIYDGTDFFDFNFRSNLHTCFQSNIPVDARGNEQSGWMVVDFSTLFIYFYRNYYGTIRHKTAKTINVFLSLN